MSAIASSSSVPLPAPPKRASPWKHLIAGGLGGMGGAIVTAPLDVVKTRLQSSLYQDVIRQEKLAAQLPGGSAEVVVRRTGGLLYNFVETGHILRDIHRYEGPSALFRGLGPTLVGVIPARSINFFTYGNGKLLIADKLNGGVETPVVHLSAAVLAGIVTSTITNPIWVVKTRLQLNNDKRGAVAIGKPEDLKSRLFRSANLTMSIVRKEGIKGLYKGLSASYLGVTEGTIQWVLYERLKKRVAGQGGMTEWLGMLGAAGTAKFTASLITYPHEVLRTRLRQDPPIVNGIPKPKYTGLYQTLRLVLKEEGAAALYGGLSAHLLRVIPNAVIMYTVYETFLRYV